MDVITTVATPFLCELDIFLAFTWRDISASIVPGSLFAISAARNNPQLPLPSLIPSYLFLILWLMVYLYFFNLSNQIMGLDEDRVNKPDRPIPSGKVTLGQAKRRWAMTLSAFLALAAFEPAALLLETLCWVLTVALLCATPVGAHWFGKNTFAMPLGAWSIYSASWKIIAPLTPKSKHYIFAMSLWAGLGAQIQDLRDIEGDTAVGRKTMQIVFGDRQTRFIITFILIPASFVVIWMGGIVSLAPFTLAAVHLYLGYRVMRAGGSRYDHKTYMIFTYTFCLLVALTAGEGLTLDVNMPQGVFNWTTTAPPTPWNHILSN